MKVDEDDEFLRNMEKHVTYVDKEEDKLIRGVTTHSYVVELLEEINKELNTGRLIYLRDVLFRAHMYSAFFKEEPRLSLWERYAKRP